MRSFLLAITCSLVWPCALVAEDRLDYLRDVKPILKARCFVCHGAVKQESGLRLDTARLMRTGGDGGPAIQAGVANKSLLIERITAADDSERMPPEGKPLAAKQIALLTAWINQGAVAPADEQPEEDPRKHWAFLVPQRPAVPEVKRPEWVRNPIDAFIAAEHTKRGLSPNAPATRAALLRRVSLDLIGLPPTRQQLHAYLADDPENGYQSTVDRLLASPQYGERWGRHWMDVWRYSDWYGRRAVNDVRNSYPQIWRWRDWIVNSLNADKGYDRMVMEMLAADEIAPEDDRAVVATGYIVRNWFSLNYNQWMKDLVEHTGKAFLGLRFNCAHCHDHKYDPLTQHDYFAFRAFFEPLEMRHGRVPGEPDPGPYLKYVYASSKKPIQSGLVRVFDEKLDAKTVMYLGGDTRNVVKDKPPVPPGVPAFLGGNDFQIVPIDLPPESFYPGLKGFVQNEELSSRRDAVKKAETALAKSRQKPAESLPDLTQQVKQLESAAARLEQQLAVAKEIPVVAPKPETPRRADTAITDLPTELAAATNTLQLARWNLRAAQLVVAAGEAQLENARAQLNSIQARIAADNVRFKNKAGNADQLAHTAAKAERFAAHAAAKFAVIQAEKAMVEAELKAAVDPKAKPAVAKAKQQLANSKKSVAKTETALKTDDGKYSPLSPMFPKKSTGRRAALARWIASRNNPLTARVAVNHIWMRHFGRPLVESVFDFGRSGQKPSHPALLDWLATELMDNGWRMKHIHRLIVSSNTYRMASTRSGDANPTNPNRAVDADNRYLWRFNARRLEAEIIRDAVLHTSGQLDLTLGGRELDNKLGSTSRRRSLYFSLYPESGGQMKFMTLFDPPNPGDCYRRTESTVPQQALAMTNSSLLLSQSRLLARKLAGEVEPERFVAAAFEQILTRSPTNRERTSCLAFLNKQVQLFRGVDPKQLKGQPAKGTTAAATDPELRARESLVRVLFNHTDFVTIH